MTARLSAVSVDLDGLGCYAAIHGLTAPLSDAEERAVPEVALARLCEVFADAGVPATLFAIGSGLHDAGAAGALRRAAAAGHEVGSHSFAHDYALSRRSQEEIEADLRRAEEAIEAACGVRPVGFRAPGYTLSPRLLAALRRRGYLYDSSLLPSPPYYAAKAVALGLYRLRGRRSFSILGGVGQLAGPRRAHLRGGIRELPVATLPLLRAPVIGTVVLALPVPAARLAASLARAGGFFNLELHGIDALDASDAVPAALVRAQPGLGLPARKKLARLRALLERLRAQGEVVRLEEAARRLLPAPPGGRFDGPPAED